MYLKFRTSWYPSAHSPCPIHVFAPKIVTTVEYHNTDEKVLDMCSLWFCVTRLLMSNFWGINYYRYLNFQSVQLLELTFNPCSGIRQSFSPKTSADCRCRSIFLSKCKYMICLILSYKSNIIRDLLTTEWSRFGTNSQRTGQRLHPSLKQDLRSTCWQARTKPTNPLTRRSRRSQFINQPVLFIVGDVNIIWRCFHPTSNCDWMDDQK